MFNGSRNEYTFNHWHELTPLGKKPANKPATSNADPAQTKELTILIVHYNEMRFMPGVLDSLKNSTYHDFKLLILDNNSAPENRAALQELVQNYPELDIELILNKYDLYYTGGNNVGFKVVKTPYACVMNPDICFEPDFLSKAMSFFDSEYKPDVFTPKALYYATKKRIWYAGAKLTPYKKIFTRHIGILMKDGPAYSTIQETDYANGACLFIKKNVLDTIGFFDEILVMYSDDTDFSLRARQHGFKVFYNGTCSFYHKVKVNLLEKDKRMSIRNSKFLYYLLLRNSVIVLWKFYPIHTIIGSYLTWCLYNIIAATVLNIRFKKFKLIAIHFRAVLMGSLIGLRRRTNKSCKTIFSKEIRFIHKL